MPQLLLVTTDFVTVEAFLLPIARHFRGKGWRVDVLSGGQPQGNSIRACFDQVFTAPWSRNPMNPNNLLLGAPRFIQIANARDYDLVHTATPIASFVTRLAAQAMPAKRRPSLIYTAHGFHFHSKAAPLRNALFLGMERLAGRWTDYLLVINKDDEDAARLHRLVRAERLRRMPGAGVDTARFSPDQVSASDVARIRSELGFVASDRYFLMVAEFIPRKRHGDLILAFAQLVGRNQGKDAHLVFAGTGPSETVIRKQVRTLAIEKRVHFLGFRRDVPQLMRGAEALILPSEQEGLPTCVIEAMSLEVPVIATRIRGSSDLLEDGCGLLVETGDIASMTNALEQALVHPAKAYTRAKKGRDRVAQYDIRNVIHVHETLYADALRERAVSRQAASERD